MNVIDAHSGRSFAAYNCDTVEFSANLPADSIDLSVYSPPFAHLFVYSDSERDMGNVADYSTFGETYRHLTRSLFAATKPGRVSCVHCSDIPTTKSKDGVIGLFDLPSVIREAHEREGWVYASRVTIWKDPVVEMQRTKAHGLLYKTFRTDASRCRTGMPDYMLIFRKPVGAASEKTPVPVLHDERAYPVHRWQEIASPVWMTIDQTDVLNVKIAREDNDERHLCPLQLDVIERSLTLYSNRGDTVFSPFMGIGSEGWVSLRMGRKFLGTELKEAYFRQAVKNLGAGRASRRIQRPLRGSRSMNTPRMCLVAIHVPDFVTDQQFANDLYKIIRRAVHPRDPNYVYPDPKSLEVHVYTASAEEDAFMRANVFKAPES